MAIERSGCFQERIKFLSNEQEFSEAAVRLCACDFWGCHRVRPAMTDTAVKSNTMASGQELIASPDSQPASVCSRRQSEPRSKGGREVSMTGEPTSQGDIDQRHQSVSNQRLSLCQAQFEQIAMRRLSRCCSECAEEMSPAVAAFSG